MSEQPHLPGCWLWADEVFGAERWQRLIETVSFCEDSERLLDLFGDLTGASHSFAEV